VRRVTPTDLDRAALAAAAQTRARDGPRPLSPVRCRKGPKRHGINRERSRVAVGKARRAKLAAAGNLAALRRLKAAVRAYWRGKLAEYPADGKG
jgi:hypothetical protein